jgi:hypothetical protein
VGKRWIWVARSMLAVYIVSLVLEVILQGGRWARAVVG